MCASGYMVMDDFSKIRFSMASRKCFIAVLFPGTGMAPSISMIVPEPFIEMFSGFTIKKFRFG